MSELLRALTPLEVEVPEQLSNTYPGNDAWLELEAAVQDPGADPAWAMVEIVPAQAAVPAKPLNTTVSASQIKTDQSKFGGSSLFGNGTGFALTTPDHNDWNFGAGDFTIEGFYRFTSKLKNALIAQATRGSTADSSWEVTTDVGTNQLSFLYSTTGASMDAGVNQPFTITLNQWVHLCCVRIGAVIKLFVDGVQTGADFNIGAAVLRDSAQPLTIGGDARTTGNDLQGYTDELRVSKGIARYTANFTPPTAPFVRDDYTVLLCHFDGADGTVPIADDSAKAGIPFDPGTDPAWLEVER